MYFYSLPGGVLAHRRVTLSIKFASVHLHLHSWVQRGTVKVKCLAKNTMPCPQPGYVCKHTCDVWYIIFNSVRGAFGLLFVLSTILPLIVSIVKSFFITIKLTGMER